jgi:hypothetical protein
MKECVPEPLWVVESPTKRKYGGRVARSCLRVVDAKDGREKKATARIGCCRIILEIWKKKKILNDPLPHFFQYHSSLLILNSLR